MLVALFVIVGAGGGAVPAIVVFMPIVRKLTELHHLDPVHTGVVIVTTLVVFGRARARSRPLYVVFGVVIAVTVLVPERRPRPHLRDRHHPGPHRPVLTGWGAPTWPPQPPSPPAFRRAPAKP
jgi:hypothetical protein